MPIVRDAERLRQMLMARHSAVRVVTGEEETALEVVHEAAAAVGLPVRTWSAMSGVTSTLLGPSTDEAMLQNPEVALAAFQQNLSATDPAAYIFLDLSDHFLESNPRPLRAFREFVQALRRIANDTASTIVLDPRGRARTTPCAILIDHRPAAPEIVSKLTTPFELGLPNEEEIEQILRKTLQRLNKQAEIEVNLTRANLTAILRNLRGLSRTQIQRLVTDAVANDLKFNADDLELITLGKRRMLSSGGLLEFVDAPATIDGIGGLDRLKSWLRQREGAFSDEARDYGVRPPRGVLLLGVQGAGKSLCAKAVAAAWKRPLLRMDPGALFDRYVGESERRLRDALHQAEAMAPIILWIDEIEKGFASAASLSTDGGLSKRMFGTLLTWMQEHDSPVFLFATANDIEALPPELLRKGRFDEIFFVDLPTRAARRQIFEIHLKRRSRDPKSFDLDALADAAEGFSGAEIEQAVVAGLTGAFADRRPLDTAQLLAIVRESPPLSTTMREKIEQLRAWARGRCLPAD